MMQLISIRLPPETIERLRALARQEAVRRNENVTWSRLVRETIDNRLAVESPPKGNMRTTYDAVLGR
jgi:predicted DNA-binding protein